MELTHYTDFDELAEQQHKVREQKEYQRVQPDGRYNIRLSV